MRRKKGMLMAAMLAASLTVSVLSPAGVQAEDAEKVVTALVGKGLDPTLGDTIVASQDMRLYEMIYEPLVKYGNGGEIEPALAESWEISEDGKTYTFHLRKDAKFSDGSDFNADVALMNINRWAWDGLSAPLVEANKIDDYTIELVFENAAYPIIIELTYPRPYRMLAESALDEDGNFKEMIGTGEWMIESYEIDQEVVLVPNPYYYGDAPKVDKVILKQVADGQSRCMAMQSGEADISLVDLPTENKAVIDADENLATFEFEGKQSFFLIQNDENEMLQDINVRKALNYAVDKQTLVESLLDGQGEAATSLMTRNTPYLEESAAPGYAYDLEKAKDCLAEAGYEDTDGDGIVEKDGTPLILGLTFQTAEFSEWKGVCEFLQAEYAKIGIGIELNSVDDGTYYDAIWDTRDFDLIIYRSYDDSWNPHGFIKSMFYDDKQFAGSNRGVLWTDPELSKKIGEVIVSTDETERQTLWTEIFNYIDENAYTVPLYYPAKSYVHNVRLKNVVQAPTAYESVEWNLLDVE